MLCYLGRNSGEMNPASGGPLCSPPGPMVGWMSPPAPPSKRSPPRRMVGSTTLRGPSSISWADWDSEAEAATPAAIWRGGKSIFLL